MTTLMGSSSVATSSLRSSAIASRRSVRCSASLTGDNYYNYKTLSLRPGATEKEVKKAFRKLALKVKLGSLSRTGPWSNQSCLSIRHNKQNAIYFNARKKNRCTMISATTDGNGLPVTEPKISEQANTEEKPQNNDENALPSVDNKRPPLTARERLRAARVLSKYAESNPKPPKSEFGSKVLEAIRETDKGKKRGSRLPEAPTNLLDDSKRGLPQGKWTISNPFGADVLAVVVSFLLITTIMFGTTYLVWKVGAIHFNEY